MVFQILASCPDVQLIEDEFVAKSCPTRAEVDSFLEKSLGSKDGYFKQLLRDFPATRGLTDSGIRVRTTSKLCFLGDSLVREIFLAWSRIAPWSKSEYRSTSCLFLNPANSNYNRLSVKIAQERLQFLESSNCNTIIVGGLGPHCMRRQEGIPPEKAAVLPAVPLPVSLTDHKILTEEVITALVKVSETTKIPVILVGSPIVESDVMLLDPPKPDWDGFRDFAMSKLRAFGEKEAFDRLVGAKEGTGPLGAGSSIRFYYHSQFHLRCPGFRCDGMHAENSVKGASACHPNPGFSDYPFLAFLDREGFLDFWARGNSTAKGECIITVGTQKYR